MPSPRVILAFFSLVLAASIIRADYLQHRRAAFRAAPAASLDTNGLIVKYWLDEADSGSGPTTLDDKAESFGDVDDIDLAITYASGGGEADMVWTNANGNAALHSDAVSGDYRCDVSFFQSGKLYDQLDGSQTATLELVAAIDDLHNSGGRIVHMDDDAGASGQFSLRGTGTDDLEFYLETNSDARAAVLNAIDVSNLDNVRAVYHVVVDTTQATAANRVKIYTNGVLMATATTAPTQNSTILLDDTDGLWLLNRLQGGNYARSMAGDLHYVAIYDQAFDASRVSTHNSVLQSSDDST